MSDHLTMRVKVSGVPDAEIDRIAASGPLLYVSQYLIVLVFGPPAHRSLHVRHAKTILEPQ